MGGNNNNNRLSNRQTFDAAQNVLNRDMDNPGPYSKNFRALENMHHHNLKTSYH